MSQSPSSALRRHLPRILAATVMMLLAGVLYAWSTFRLEIADRFPAFSTAQLSLNFTLTMCSFCIGGFLSGRLSARISRARLIRAAGALLLLGFGGAALLRHVPASIALGWMYLTYGVLSGLGVGIAYNAILAGTTQALPQHTGAVSGILLMGFSFGSLVLGIPAGRLFPLIGIEGVFGALGVLLFAAMLAGSFLFEGVPAAAAPSPDALPTEEGVPPSVMIRKPSFLLYFLWNVVCSSSGMLVINSSSAIAEAFGCAAALGLTVSLVGGIGRPLVGRLTDSVSRFTALSLMNGLLLAAGLSLLAGAAGAGRAFVIAGMLTVGVVYGGGVTISAAVIRSLYGSRYYPVNFSICNFVSIPASFLGPLISGILQDRSGGDFTSSFRMLLLLGAAGFLLLLLMALSVRREKARG